MPPGCPKPPPGCAGCPKPPPGCPKPPPGCPKPPGFCPVRLPEAAGLLSLSGLTEAAGLTGPAELLPARSGLPRRCEIDECPLVVDVHPVVQLDRGLLALRGDALNAHRQLRARRAAAESALPTGLAERSRAPRRAKRSSAAGCVLTAEAGAWVGVGATSGSVGAPACAPGCVEPAGRPPSPGTPGCAPPTGMIWNSSSVTGSLYFLRRNFCSTRMSTEGGKVLAYLRWNSMIARRYCSPRQMSSSSRSRWVAWLHTGSAAPIRTAMTLMLTRSAAMA